MDQVDVLVIGAGPAGSTTAALIRKYNPSLRVRIVEQAAFPRHHIGESLILELNRVLIDMGALDAVAGAGFIKKSGVTFIWGEDRRPWKLLFDAGRPAAMPPDPDGSYRYSWHVERSRYDVLLLDVARSRGVEVQQGRVTEFLEDAAGRVTGAKIEDADGARAEVGARFVVDAGGRNSLLAQRIGTRVWEPLLRNIAVYGYWQGAHLPEDVAGTWDKAQIVVLSAPEGWIWYIPISEGVVSVGIVSSHERFQGRAQETLEAYYRECLLAVPEVSAWLADAELVHLPGAPRRVLTEHDFAYIHDKMWAPGCALVGDAAGFIDPVFSVGVFLAQSSAQLLAYTVGTLLQGGDGAMDEARLLTAYDQHARVGLNAFRAMAYVFYAFNSSPSDWWARARTLVRSQALPEDITNVQAFFALTSGYGVNTSLFSEASNFIAQNFGAQVADALWNGARDVHVPPERLPAPRVPGGDERPRVVRPYRVSASAVPVEGSGRMVPMDRVEFEPLSPTHEDPGFPRHLFVPEALRVALERLDGSVSIDALRNEILGGPAFRGADPRRSRDAFNNLIRSLAGLQAFGAS